MTRDVLTRPETASRSSDSRSITYDEFLDWDKENQHVEWVEGRIVHMSPASRSHQDVAGFLKALLRIYVEQQNIVWIKLGWLWQRPLPPVLNVVKEWQLI